LTEPGLGTAVKEQKRCQTPDIRRASGGQLNTLQTVVSPLTTTQCK